LRLSGKFITTEGENSEVKGFCGHPASEIEAIWISTFSPFVIGISNWFTFTEFELEGSSVAHMYIPFIAS
jgi:hypothetical protein